jgi:hypothetical protein
MVFRVSPLNLKSNEKSKKKIKNDGARREVEKIRKERKGLKKSWLSCNFWCFGLFLLDVKWIG